MFAPMKRLLQWIALAALVLCSNSCGLPQLLGRTAGNAIDTASAWSGAAAAAL